ncbi:unnamed protein product [Ostreobium quekettii]|uniref:Apple domain-containing protein n=1 Tax=Ostreobium quekettii TaxID=121088 RepID=A0A8S1J2R0_9CHLO|nr:unnamed protein product [Ostreobium quekettii]
MNLAVLLAALLPLLARPAPAPSQCAIEDDVDYRGSDITILTGVNNSGTVVPTAQDCCNLCGNSEGCLAWTFVKDPQALGPGLGDEVGECWMKDRFKPGWMEHECCTSGVVVSANPKPPPCETEVNYDYEGGDMNNGLLNVVASAGDCCRQCRSTRGCQSWTFVKEPNVLGERRKEGECWLKDRLKPGRRASACCVSGATVHSDNQR